MRIQYRLILPILTIFSVQGFAQIKSPDPAQDTLPGFLTKRYFRKDPAMILRKEAELRNPFSLEYTNTATAASYSSLSRSGNISRGITVGNNQDLSVSSGFNLQLSGRLSEEVQILAAISDDNVPIQPEGNTQQIQEFDRVFIQLFNDKYSVTAGDFELRKPNSYFLYYLKKVKGVQVQASNQINSNLRTNNSASVSIAKGKYNRMVFFGTEGVQGPYRLRGLNNEQFIIVLAGTERVFIDGQLLKRGDNEDYTIDYNNAEISFSPKRVITAYSRIIIEFEYSERSFSRSLSTVNSEWRSKNWNAQFNFYNEQDNKNRPLLQDLGNEQKLFLSQQGDNLENAYFSSVDSAGFSSTEIRYREADSNGQKIYVYSTNPELAIYRLSFTELGPNQGNYVLDQNLGNGRVFKYVAPLAGLPQGSFEPVVLLVAPRKSSMASLGFEQKINAAIRYKVETALSIRDNNLYSEIGDADNFGYANKVTLESRNSIGQDTANSWILTNAAQAEILSDHFRFVEFFRPAEFNRDYNIDPNIVSSEQWYSYQTGIELNSQKLLSYRLGIFQKDTFYRGIQHGISSQFENKKYLWKASASVLNNDLSQGKVESFFLKHKAELTRRLRHFQVGISEENEYNTLLNVSADTLQSLSFAFSDYRVFIASPANMVNTYRLEYANRLDKTPIGSQLQALSRGQTISFSNELNKNLNHLLAYTVSYRKLDLYRQLGALQEEENLIGRWRYDARFFKGFIVSNAFYELGTGREPKRAFTYLQVPAGQGVYVHRDYNGNGIKELNEFEVAKFAYEADFIRISTLSNEFVRTKSTIFSENLLIDPSQILSDQTVIGKWVSKFSNQSTFKIDRKVLTGSNEPFFNPFDLNIADSNLITINTQYRNSTFFQRSNPVFGMEYALQGANAKSLLNLGFENRSNFEQVFRTRWTFYSQFSLNSELKSSNKKSNNDIAIERNYEISGLIFSPEIAWQYNAALRMALIYSLQASENQLGSEELRQQSLSADLRYQAGGQSSLQSKIAFIQNRFTGNSNSAIAYEMLNGLQAGSNITWNLNYQRNVGTNLQLSFVYEGRSASNAATIHSGSMQARAFF